MSRPVRLVIARRCAEALIKDEGITTLPVDPFALAASRDITVEGKPETHDGVSGMLLRHGNSFGIIYATHIPSAGFQRFSVSHELGHYFLEGHIDQLLQTGVHVSRAGFVTADPYELEADHFAAGLLMPEKEFREEMERHEPGLAAVDALAARCITSRTATAIRYAELNRAAIAVIVSTDGVIDYCFLSDSMKTLPQLSWLRKGTKLPAGSATAQLSDNPDRVRAGATVTDEADVRDWLGGTMKAVVTEESAGLGGYGKILTILSSEYIGGEEDDDDEEDEDDLIERWTPRFR